MLSRVSRPCDGEVGGVLEVLAQALHGRVADKTVRGITGLHVIEHKASVENGKIEEYRVTMEVTFILEH